MGDFLIDCSGAVLAGGENRRMPVPKAFIEVKGEKIIERTLNIMKGSFREVFIVTNQPEIYTYLGVPMLGDIYDVRGPMTGIFTTLVNASNPWVFISACDMPFINRRLIQYMAAKRHNADAVIPVAKGKTQPLFDFYSSGFLPGLEKALTSGNKSIRDFLNNKRVEYISEREIKEFDPELRSFINLNSPEDVYMFLKPQDRLKYEKIAARRGKCLVLEQQS
jgi:molybdopterin-guanine dinucleotide biosynthesis protein A